MAKEIYSPPKLTKQGNIKTIARGSGYGIRRTGLKTPRSGMGILTSSGGLISGNCCTSSP